MTVRPVLVFDGKCGFCRMWTEFWQSLTGDRVEYVPFQSAAERFPDVPEEEFRGAVQYITPTLRLQGAEAVAKLLADVPGYGWMDSLYRAAPGFAILADALYGFVAKHRNLAHRVTKALWGERVVRPLYHEASAIFSKALSFIYLIAFASFGMQLRGLVGAQGILPAATYFRFAIAQLGSAAYWRVPSLFWWSHSDFAMLSIAWGGVALAAISILAKPHSGWQKLIFGILFVYYLSIVSAGQIFMGYQWDLLLLEAGFLAIFLRPARPRVWLPQWLLFRLLFESGLVKLLSGDPSWRGLTALTAHYETQPLPTALAWVAQQLPGWFQRFSTGAVLAIELVLPFLIFGPRKLKQSAAFGVLGLQVLIFATGNYTFFNLLTMALCLFLFDDAFFAGLRKKAYRAGTPGRANLMVSGVLITVVMALSFIGIGGMFGVSTPQLTEVAETVAPFGIVNQYGLFAVMTTKRPEVEVEGSLDGEHWLPYTFRYKAGPLNRLPGWVAPFQPRLDWQMWFAALGSFRQNPWFVRFMISLLEGSKPVLALLERDPFGGRPPAKVRALVYEYHFTGFGEWRKTGNWWKRELKGTYFPPVGLKSGGTSGAGR